MMGYGDFAGYGWIWMTMGFVFWALVIGLVFYGFTRVTAGTHRREAGPTAEDILRDRFARGEIDAAEYEARRRVIRG